MSSLDVLNPVTGFSTALGFNPNWSYRSERSGGNNVTRNKPSFGPSTARVARGDGYGFTLTFVDRPIEQVEYLNHFFEAFAGDGFTLVDWDNKGRHHVGVFTARPKETHTANGRYNVTVPFEDLPGATMLQYPTQATAALHDINVVDANLNARAAVLAGTWTPTLPTGISANSAVDINGTVYNLVSSAVPANYFLFNATPAAGDAVQFGYVGWGFHLGFLTDPSYGVCSIYVDGMLVASGLDLAAGTGTVGTAPVALDVTLGTTPDPEIFPPATGQTVGLFTCENLPLGRHLVKIVAAGPLEGRTGNSIAMPALRYFY